MKQYYVYIITNKPNGVLYIGRSENLASRIHAHKSKSVEGFSKKYNLDKLVYFEEYTDPEYAAEREKRMKNWNRNWKIDLIQKDNPNWEDLYFKLNL